MARARSSVVIVLGVVALGAGCLSTPGPATQDGGDDDGGGRDAAPDGPLAPRCPSTARPAGQAWPPVGIDVYAATIADINGDDVDDLVVNVAAASALSDRPAAVYVLYGPVSTTAPEYHVALDLDDDTVDAHLQPWALSLDDLDRDGCLDLTVAGPATAGHTRDAAAVFRHDGSAQAWTGAATIGELSFRPAAGPTMVAWGDLTANADPDLVVADLYTIDVLPGSTVAALGSNTTVPRPVCQTWWSNINAIRLQPRAGQRDRLLIFGHYQTNTVTFDDLGTIEASANCAMQDQPITRAAATIDLDGVAPLDVLSAGGSLLGAHVITGDALPVAPMTGAMTCDLTPRGGYLEGLAVGDMGGSTAPDAVIIDRDAAGSFACLVMSLTVDAGRTTVARNGYDELALGTGQAQTVAIGDVTTADGTDVRAWIFDTDGRLHCVRRMTGSNTLAAC